MIAAGGRALRVAGLFAGIGGIELGLSAAGHEAVLLAELLPEARAVLAARMDASVVPDVREIADLPAEVDLLTAGFPCQDLSSVGRKGGISGTKSKLVGEVFRLIERRPVDWVVMENVPFLLHLDKGKAMRLVVGALEELGYAWAYRVVDTQAFGLPQRRRRVVIVASRVGDPRGVLLADDGPAPSVGTDRPAHGFYWTEGTRALGWAIDAVPPIKGGSSVGVASPPAILCPDGTVGTPDLHDAERLQGFPAGWTAPAAEVAKDRYRWRLVGNAVSVPVSTWVGRRLSEPGAYLFADAESPLGDRWPKAAHGAPGRSPVAVPAGLFPVVVDRPPLMDFLDHPLVPLSRRATGGFLRRYRSGTLRRKPLLEDALDAHLARMAAADADRSAA